MGNTENSNRALKQKLKQGSRSICNQMGQISEKICLELSEQQYNHTYHWYNKRLNMLKYVFKIKSITILSTKYCEKNLHVEIQYQYCVNIKKIKTPQNQTLYILMSMLYGFAQLFSVCNSSFSITLDMVWINMKGEVKVWYNQDPLENDLNYSNQDAKAQHILVKRIFELIQSDMNYELPNSLDLFKKQNLKHYTFSEAISMIKQFARVNNFRIPNRIQKLKEHLNQKQQYHEKKISDITYASSVVKQKPIHGSTMSVLKNVKDTLDNYNFSTPSKQQQYNNSVATTIKKQSKKETTNEYHRRDRSFSQNHRQNKMSQSFKINEPQQGFDVSRLENSNSRYILAFQLQQP